jgi:hypothetical protein
MESALALERSLNWDAVVTTRAQRLDSFWASAMAFDIARTQENEIGELFATAIRRSADTASPADRFDPGGRPLTWPSVSGYKPLV